MKNLFLAIISLVLLCSYATHAAAHCQVPCGIYDDELRFESLKEHVATLEKAMNQITELSQAEEKNFNQIVRWITAKADHSSKINEIVTYYFMAQRVKPQQNTDAQAYSHYQQQLVLLHQILVHTMQAQQTNDLSHIEALRELIDSYRALYYGKEKLHEMEHHTHTEHQTLNENHTHE